MAETSSALLGVERSAQEMRWIPRLSDERVAMAMAQQLGLSDVVARILAGRGVSLEQADSVLHPTLKHLLPDPSHLKDMDAAVDRLVHAIGHNEPIAVLGDYDVDGATSTAIMRRYFAQLGVPLLTYIPDRMKEGYGPNIPAFDSLQAQGAKVIVTVDCGTVSFEPIAHAAAKGLDVIVIDHHVAEARLPEAVAVINPNRLDDDSEHGNLAAVGVMFLTLIALNRRLRKEGYFAERSEPNLLHWLDIVALGTICDVVPLTGLNRALVAQGMRVMAGRTNPGIRALCDIARVDETPTTYHAGFVIGPRINAGGRVGKAGLGSDILSLDDDSVVRDIAQQLDTHNAERQAIEAGVLEAATKQAEQAAPDGMLLVAGEGWHEGVIGIAAGRLKDAYQRPAAVIALQDGVGKGSARSVPGADLGAAITAARGEGLLLAGGGHAMAAGFSVEAEKLEALHDFLNARLNKAISHFQATRSLKIDAVINSAGANLELVDAMEAAGPYGQGFPSPTLVLAEAMIQYVTVVGDSHLRVIVKEPHSDGRLTAMAFRSVGTALGELLQQSQGKRLHLAGNLKRNSWQGNESAQFMINDAAPL